MLNPTWQYNSLLTSEMANLFPETSNQPLNGLSASQKIETTDLSHPPPYKINNLNTHFSKLNLNNY